MEDNNEGSLCQVCTAALQGKTLIPDREDWHQSNIKNVYNVYDYFDRAHHENYSSFSKSKDEGCCICSWLWANHTPPPPASGQVDDLKILGRIDAYGVHFCVTCPWAAESELLGTSSTSSVER